MVDLLITAAIAAAIYGLRAGVLEYGRRQFEAGRALQDAAWRGAALAHAGAKRAAQIKPARTVA